MTSYYFYYDLKEHATVATNYEEPETRTLKRIPKWLYNLLTM